MSKVFLAKLLTLKVAAAAVAATAVGGVALAATAALPNPAQNPTNPDNAPPANASGPSRGAGDNEGSPNPSTHGLCRAYLSGATDNSGKALDNPAFQALVDEAGGADNLDTYCADLLADTPSGGPPSGPPVGPPAGLPTGPPAEHPTGPPAAVPGRPSAPATP